MLERANYDMLSKDDAEIALSQDFLNSIPIEPEWLKLDPVFESYLATHPEIKKNAAPFSTRLWIFHRGVGVAEHTGLLVMQKLNALLFLAFGRCCGKKKK